ncbi:hemicentin-2-like [Haematobia irritans]|uniref:hemicentin-2-like n=1 Tax=Haematobia irritans TaxID=7368 RepID=UPI003F50A306
MKCKSFNSIQPNQKSFSTMHTGLRVTTGISQTCVLLVFFIIDLVHSEEVTEPFNAFKIYEETMAKSTVPAYTPPPWIDPYFDPATPRNVTALMGKSAYLSCRVRNLGNKTVSWIRHRDMHILTVGTYTYTTDLRFQAIRHSESDDWTLQIKWAQKRDAGVYECQISTQPVHSYFVDLHVVVPTANIHGGPDFHVDKGSTINLTCTVKFSLEPPAYIFWYHHEEVINYDSTRGGVSVITEKGDVTTSYLLIQNADLADSGKYSCAPSNADVASVRVHVLSGEHPEAMQTESSSVNHSSGLTLLWSSSLLLCVLQLLLHHMPQYIFWRGSEGNPKNNETITKLATTNKTTTTTTTTTDHTSTPCGAKDQRTLTVRTINDLHKLQQKYGEKHQNNIC